MAKYYALLVLAFFATLLYIFLSDPCNNTLRNDFLEKYPDYEILFSGAGSGGDEVVGNTVHCHIRYRVPEGIGTYEDVWVYQDSGDGWEMTRILEEHRRVE